MAKKEVENRETFYVRHQSSSPIVTSLTISNSKKKKNSAHICRNLFF